MELRQIHYFNEIVRCASFGQAAERLHVTQPALSKSIRNLEQSLGVTLLERHPGGVTPTEYGKLFLDYSSLVAAEIERLQAEIEQMKGAGRGIVRVGAGATMMQYVVPQAVRAFVAMDNTAAVTFRQGLRDDLIASLRRGEVDLIVGSVRSLEDDEEFRREIVMHDEIVVVANRDHALTSRAAVPVSELANHNWVLPDGTEGERDRLTRVLKAAGHSGPACVISTPSSNFMATMLQDNAYLSYLPRALIGQCQDYAHLRPVKVATPIWDTITVGVIYRRRGVMLAPVRRFINRLVEAGQAIEEGEARRLAG